MILYDFCRALARRADKTVGIDVCRGIVEEHQTLLQRTCSEDEFREAFYRTLELFAPSDGVALVQVPFTSRRLAEFLIWAISGGRIPARETWQTQPVLQNHLAAAMRHLVLGVLNVRSAPAVRPAARARTHLDRATQLGAFLTEEEATTIVWGEFMSHPGVVLHVAQKLAAVPTPSRAVVLAAIRDDLVERGSFDQTELVQVIDLYTSIPAAKA